jgi:hypothetical protein
VNERDPELAAMETVAEALQVLEPTSQARVLAWARSRFGGGGSTPETIRPESTSAFPDFPALFDAASPTTDADRALTAAYWVQFVQNGGDFDAQVVNSMLKNMGHGISNITKALSRAQAARPALVLQVHKSGRLQQARKKYRLTTEGIRHVESLMGHSEA